jgi:hypothetical protein
MFDKIQVILQKAPILKQKTEKLSAKNLSVTSPDPPRKCCGNSPFCGVGGPPHTYAEVLPHGVNVTADCTGLVLGNLLHL